MNQFYLERDKRTNEYLPIEENWERPVQIKIGKDASESFRGQLLSIAFINLVARIHRNIHISVHDFILMVPKALVTNSMPENISFKEALRLTAITINPFISISWGCNDNILYGLGIGLIDVIGMPWYIGIENGLVKIDKKPLSIDQKEGFSFGACLAACIGSSLLVKQVLSMPIFPFMVSAWNFMEGKHASSGPVYFQKLDIGNAFIVGAGGVGSCLSYWLRQCSIKGDWYFIDGDFAELHNTNRCMGIIPNNTGFNNSIKENKANIAARMCDAISIPQWYDEINQDDYSPDIIIPLANERNVREHISIRGEPILLHATTSKNWQAQLHRHIPEIDDCISCRIPPPKTKGNFECSVSEINIEGVRTDAALPFLSATAALMLLASLYRLLDRSIFKEKTNIWRFQYNSHEFCKSGICRCGSDCKGVPNKSIRSVNQEGKKWEFIDKK